MTGASRRQRIQALLFAAIMVVSMVAAGVGGLAGSAAAETTTVSSSDELIDAVDGEDPTAISGDTVVINESFSLDDDVSVNVENITIEGESGDETVSQGSDDSTKVFQINSANVTLRDINLRSEISINANDVSVREVNISTPDSGFGIKATGVSGVVIENNTIRNTGVNIDETAQAVYLSNSSGTIDQNTIRGVADSNEGSSKAIFVGDSDEEIEASVTITDNRISNVSVNESNFGDGGAGAYGVLVNADVSDLEISGNNIHNLSGLWAHGIGLEGPTPGANVTDNLVTNLSATKGDTSDSSAFRDEAAIFFEDNTGAQSVSLDNNTFENLAYGVLPHPDQSATSTVGEIVIVDGPLQTAVNHAGEDDTILVSPGIYESGVDVSTNNITLEGPNADTPAHERDATDLSGEAVINTSNGPGIEVSNSANVTIDGVAFDGNEYFIESTDWENLAVEDTIFTNGQSKTGGHIWLKSSSGEFRFENNYVTGNNPSNGIRLKNGDDTRIGVSIKNNVWENNHAWAMNLNHAQGVVENNTVRNTEQFDPESEYEDYKQWGVLLAASNNDIRVANNTFESLTGPSVDLYGNFDGKIAISQNTFANTTVDSGSVEISDTQLDNDGFQPTFGDISISRNMFVDNNVSLKNEVDADIDARYNYFSDAPTVEGNVIYDPVLTAPVEDVADSTSDIRQYGSYLEISSDDGSPIAVGFAAPPDGNASEVLGDVVDVPSTVYRYNNTADEFVSIDGSYTPSTGEVLVIAPQETLNDETIIPIATGSETAARPDSVDLTQGWNLVATGATNDPSGIAVADGGADGVINDASLQVQPAQPGAPSANTGAFEGTWLFVDADGQLFTGYTEDQSPSTYSEEVLEPDTDKTE